MVTDSLRKRFSNFKRVQKEKHFHLELEKMVSVELFMNKDILEIFMLYQV